MKAYFTSSIRLNTQNQDVVDAIRSAATTNKFDFASTYVEFSNVDTHSQLSDDEAYQVFRTAQKSLTDADVVIADVSHPSDRVGFEIATALSEKKPVLALLHETAKLAPPVQGNNSRYLNVRRYNSAADAKQIVSEFLIDAKKKVDTKFILIISPQIDKYLEWAAAERRQHKAQIVRDSVEEAMRKDKEYTEFLKNKD